MLCRKMLLKLTFYSQEFDRHAEQEVSALLASIEERLYQENTTKTIHERLEEDCMAWVSFLLCLFISRAFFRNSQFLYHLYMLRYISKKSFLVILLLQSWQEIQTDILSGSEFKSFIFTKNLLIIIYSLNRKNRRKPVIH